MNKAPEDARELPQAGGKVQKSGRKCQIQEILQYSCEIESANEQAPRVHCFPIPRIFRICSNEPAVEITRSVVIDATTGELTLPEDLILPKGKPWWAINNSPERK